MENTQQRIGFNPYSTWFNDSHWLYSAFPTIDGPSVSTCCAWLSGCRWCISCWQRAPHGVPTFAFDLQAPGGSVWQTQQPKHSASVRSVRHILLHIGLTVNLNLYCKLDCNPLNIFQQQMSSYMMESNWTNLHCLPKNPLSSQSATLLCRRLKTFTSDPAFDAPSLHVLSANSQPLEPQPRETMKCSWCFSTARNHWFPSRPSLSHLKIQCASAVHTTVAVWTML